MEVIFIVLLVSLFSHNANAQIVSASGVDMGAAKSNFVCRSDASCSSMSVPLTVNSSVTVTGSAFSVGGSTFSVAGGRVGIFTAPSVNYALALGKIAVNNNVLTSNSGFFFSPTSGRIVTMNNAGNYGTIQSEVAAGVYSLGWSETNINAVGTPVLSWADTGAVTIPGSSFSVGTSTLVVTGGKVGIGNTNPDAKLHVSGGSPQFKLQDASGSGTASGILMEMVDSSNVRQAYIWKDTGGQLLIVNEQATGPIAFSAGNSEKVRIVASGGIRPYSRTKAQILAIDPITAGEMFYCSDCTASNICISTGTAVGQFSDIQAKTVDCQ